MSTSKLVEAPTFDLSNLLKKDDFLTEEIRLHPIFKNDLLRYIDEEFIPWPIFFSRPPHNLRHLLDDVLQADSSGGAAQATTNADKLAEAQTWLLVATQYIHEIEKDLRESAKYQKGYGGVDK